MREGGLNNYRFFFPADFLEPDGNTLATVLAIELAIFATTPFLDLAFPLGFALAFDFFCAFGALLVFVLGLVVAAFFAIADSAMRYPLQITLNWKFIPPSVLACRAIALATAGPSPLERFLRNEAVVAGFLQNNSTDDSPLPKMPMNIAAKTLLAITALAVLPGLAFAEHHKPKKTTGVEVSWKDLPAAVQTTMQSNAAGGKVVEVQKETVNGVLYYYGEVKGSDHKWTKVYVLESGAFVKAEPDNARNKRKHKPLFGY